jgi:hypothetical protein
MHRFETPLEDFVQRIGKEFEIDRRAERSFHISRETLPAAPTVIILDGSDESKQATKKLGEQT